MRCHATHNVVVVVVCFCGCHGVCLQLQEEAGITATSLQHRGVLTFAFDDQQLPWEVHGEQHSEQPAAAAAPQSSCLQT
jgi:hypothetical protein